VNCRLSNFDGTTALYVRPPDKTGCKMDVEFIACRFADATTGVAPGEIVRIFGSGSTNVLSTVKVKLASCQFDFGLTDQYIAFAGSANAGSVMSCEVDMDVYVDPAAIPTIRYSGSNWTNVNIVSMSVKSNVAVDPAPISAQLTSSTGVFQGSDGIWWNGNQLTP